jgi:hypothetical protein
MSQMFETDINKWLPDDVSKPAEDRVEELGRVVGFLTVTLNKAFERIEQAEEATNRLRLNLVSAQELAIARQLTEKRFQEIVDARAALQLAYIERLEDLVTKCCDKLNIPVPFPGQNSDFGLAPKPKKGGN